MTATESSFSRTPQGLANLGLFLTTDLVVFCEGKNYVRDGEVFFNSGDQVFWEPIIQTAVPGKRYKLWPAGDKDQVKSSLKLAVSAELTGKALGPTIGCIDRDYDNLSADADLPTIGGRLFSTHGYSFENDLVCSYGVDRLCHYLMPRVPAKIRDRVKQIVHRMLRSLTHVVKIDRAFRAAGVKFLPTDGVPAFIEEMRGFLSHSVPNISAAFLRFRLRRFAELGVTSYKEFRSRYLQGGFAKPDRVLDGCLDLPGKTLIKILVDVMNKIGKALPKWGQVHHERILDDLLADHARSVAKWRADIALIKRPLSWVHVV